jgi:hypothetical protein
MSWTPANGTIRNVSQPPTASLAAASMLWGPTPARTYRPLCSDLSATLPPPRSTITKRSQLPTALATAATCHLTARQAGELAGRAGIKRLVPFHFSARYQGDAACLEREAVEVFAANQPNTTAGPDITSA